MKRLVLTSSSSGGNVFPATSVLIDPKHLRHDRSRPGDVYAIGNGMHRKNSVMDILITSALKHSCILNATKDSDHVIRAFESVNFRADARSSCPKRSSSTRCLIPLALNHLGLRGGYFSAILKEYATILVTRPSGCSLLQGPFALSLMAPTTRSINHVTPASLGLPRGSMQPRSWEPWTRFTLARTSFLY